MIDSVDAGFINTNCVDVVNRENEILRGGGDGGNPSQRLDLIQVYLLAQNWPESWTVSDVIRMVLQTSSRVQFSESWNQFAESTKEFLDAVRADGKYVAKSKSRSASRRKNGKEYDRPTRELIQLGIDFVFQNATMMMTANEWHDFFHTIVPVSYCDLVLLDKRWTNFVSQTGLTFPDIALTFDRRSIDAFFDALATARFSESEASPVL